MDKKEKIVLGVVGAVTVGIIGYELYQKMKNKTTTTTTTTTTNATYTVTLNNNCSQSITVNYTDTNGVKQSITIQPNQSQTVTVLGGTNIVYANNIGLQEIPINSNQTVNLCSKSTSSAYTTTLINQCSQSITVNYTDPSGQSTSVSVPPNSANTQIQVQPNSTITWQAYGKQQSFTVNLPDQRIMICQGAWNITVVNQYSSAVTVGYIDENQNYKTVTVSAGQNQSLTIAANSAINIGGTSYAVCGNNAYMIIYSPTNVQCKLSLPPGTQSAGVTLKLDQSCGIGYVVGTNQCVLTGQYMIYVSYTGSDGVPKGFYMNTCEATINAASGTTISVQIISLPSLQQKVLQYTATPGQTITISC